MARIFTEDFEGGSPGADLTSSNTSYGNVFISNTANGSATFSSTSIESGQSAHLTTNSSGASVILDARPTATGLLYQRLYGRLDNSDSDIIVIQLESGGTVVSQVSIEVADGTIDLKDGFTAVASTATAIPLGTLWRIETETDQGAGTQTLRLFLGANVHGSTPDEEISGSYSGGQVDTMFHGCADAKPGMNMFLDAAAADDATWVGPAQQPTQTTVYARSGGAWQPAQRYRLSGGAWT